MMYIKGTLAVLTTSWLKFKNLKLGFSITMTLNAQKVPWNKIKLNLLPASTVQVIHISFINCFPSLV